MNFLEILLIIILLFVIEGVLFYSNLFVKAGRKKWEAFVPFYNLFVLLKIIERPWWWAILLFLPVVGNIVGIVIAYEFLHVFGYRKKRQFLYTILTAGLYLAYINFNKDTKYVGRDNESIIKSISSWTGAILFAIVAATLVHTYFMRPFTIPTSSLEKSLLVGDFLFVSKFHYGARTPMTPIALPMVHDSIPGTGLPSYLKNPQLPYFRFPGLQKIKRNEIVVFNWPADSLKTMWGDNSGEFTYKPIDKKTNYVKRCVAIAGDTLQIIDGVIYINGEKSIMPDRAKPQHYFVVDTEGKQISQGALRNRYNVREGLTNRTNQLVPANDGKYYLNLTDDEAKLIKKNPSVKSVTKRLTPSGTFDKSIFPHDPQYPWSGDNYGPLYIPEEGATIEINSKTIPIYEHLIREYDRNDVTVDGDKMYINGQLATSYTFKQNYYWMMGDNRQNSLDARNYGFTPFDHVIGKPVFIWMSWENGKPRWERFFTTVHGSGKPVSYFYYFLGALALWFGFSYFRKKKKAE